MKTYWELVSSRVLKDTNKFTLIAWKYFFFLIHEHHRWDAQKQGQRSPLIKHAEKHQITSEQQSRTALLHPFGLHCLRHYISAHPTTKFISVTMIIVFYPKRYTIEMGGNSFFKVKGKASGESPRLQFLL